MEYTLPDLDTPQLSRRQMREMEAAAASESYTASVDTELIVPSAVLSSITLDDLLMRLVNDGGSDLHLSCGGPARYRVDGDLVPMEGTDEITNPWMEREMRQIARPDTWAGFESNWEADFSYELEGYGRFRVNVFRQRGQIGSVMRLIPTEIKTVAQLGLPDGINELLHKKNGLILVTGPTGSGKSTTLTAMIDAINSTRHEHIMTIEDPIEFVHQDKMSLVNQREIGADTKSFSEALKRVLRQDPDVILIGELRDADTISTALTAAETGHLVFGTLHTQSAVKTIDRIIDTFPAHQQSQVRSQLADTLQSVISQMLVKKIGGGRVATTEILVRTPAISNNIREGNNSSIYDAIQTGRNKGMHTLDQNLKELVLDGLIDKENVKSMLKDASFLDNVHPRK